jgi:hypothetical protein
LMVINHLNSRGAGEGEASVPMILSNRLVASLEAAQASDETADVVATLAAQDAGSSYGPALPTDTVSWNFASHAEGESESLDDLVDQLAPDIGSYWKRK